MTEKRSRIRPWWGVVAAAGLLTLAGCGSSSPSNPSGGAGGSKPTVVPGSSGGHSSTLCTIPQHNGGDHDSDNNGGPNDGDGCDV